MYSFLIPINQAYFTAKKCLKKSFPHTSIFAWLFSIIFFYKNPTHILNKSYKVRNKETNKCMERFFVTDFVCKIWAHLGLAKEPLIPCKVQKMDFLPNRLSQGPKISRKGTCPAG